MDHTDKKIINRIQNNFPIVSRPFQKIGEELFLSEKDVIQRIQMLKKKGIIRRIGGNFGPDKLGFKSTLCAARVEKEKIDRFTEVVNSFSGVTHNYMRDHAYNIWFTFIARSFEEIERNLKKISETTGVHDILNLPATELFKINAQFKV
ncbi:MAG: AsnC family transcriptional regulator [Thermodesulfobacteriota bacterium]|nr:AsnC family transcriptional regulator [Thermodesulfobacteriota bacterium]